MAVIGLEMDALGVTARDELGDAAWGLSGEKARPEMEEGDGGAQGLDMEVLGVTTTGDLGVETWGEAI